jgi:hypothetical protein
MTDLDANLNRLSRTHDTMREPTDFNKG